MDQKDNFNPYFNFAISKNAKQKLGFIHTYPNYEQMIKEYQKIWNATPLIYNFSFISNSSKNFDIPFNFDNNASFLLQFNVDTLKSLVHKYISTNEIFNTIDYKVEYQLHLLSTDKDAMLLKLFTNVLASEFDDSYINKPYALKCSNNDEPILCIDVTNLSSKNPPITIVDGNHRLYGKIHTNQEFINGYMIGRNIWMNSLLTNKDKLFIKILSNIQLLMCYNLGQYTIKQVKEKLYKI